MKNLFFLFLLSSIAYSCSNPAGSGANTTSADSTQKDTAAAQPAPTSKLESLSWFIGRWTQVEGPDLVSYEAWERSSPTLYRGKSWTLYHTDTVHVETIDLLQEGEDIYYIPTVPENNGPVRFKMTQTQGKSVIFENPEHDFPQTISYEAKGDTMLLAKISGAREGKVVTKEFPLKRVPN